LAPLEVLRRGAHFEVSAEQRSGAVDSLKYSLKCALESLREVHATLSYSAAVKLAQVGRSLLSAMQADAAARAAAAEPAAEPGRGREFGRESGRKSGMESEMESGSPPAESGRVQSGWGAVALELSTVGGRLELVNDVDGRRLRLLRLQVPRLSGWAAASDSKRIRGLKKKRCLSCDYHARLPLSGVGAVGLQPTAACVGAVAGALQAGGAGRRQDRKK